MYQTGRYYIKAHFLLRLLYGGYMGIAVTREVYGGVLRALSAKHPHPYPLSREIPMNLYGRLMERRLL
jgi:hypothetical protein